MQFDIVCAWIEQFPELENCQTCLTMQEVNPLGRDLLVLHVCLRLAVLLLPFLSCIIYLLEKCFFFL